MLVRSCQRRHRIQRVEFGVEAAELQRWVPLQDLSEASRDITVHVPIAVVEMMTMMMTMTMNRMMMMTMVMVVMTVITTTTRMRMT